MSLEHKSHCTLISPVVIQKVAKKKNLTSSIRIDWTNFRPPTIHQKTKYFWKSSNKSRNLTSLRFFWHLLRLNWSIFGVTVSLWKMIENGKIAVFSGKWGRFWNLMKVWNLRVTRIIDRFERKRCRKKRKDVSYQLLKELYQKWFVLHLIFVVKNLFSTYVWSKLDSLLRLAAYEFWY